MFLFKRICETAKYETAKFKGIRHIKRLRSYGIGLCVFYYTVTHISEELGCPNFWISFHSSLTYYSVYDIFLRKFPRNVLPPSLGFLNWVHVAIWCNNPKDSLLQYCPPSKSRILFRYLYSRLLRIFGNHLPGYIVSNPSVHHSTCFCLTAFRPSCNYSPVTRQYLRTVEEFC